MKKLAASIGATCLVVFCVWAINLSASSCHRPAPTGNGVSAEQQTDTPSPQESAQQTLADTQQEVSTSDTLTIAMVGDIMMGTTFPSMMLPANDGADLFRDAEPILQRTDLTLGNLEGTLCDGGQSTKGNGPNSYSFRTPTKYAPLLKQAGFDYLSMANNHANDFGLVGIESTERCLREQGILFSGIAGRVESAVIERNGLKIGLCAFGHNSYTLKHTDFGTVGRIVDQLVADCDLVIVSFHGGAEGRTQNHLPQGSETFLGENRGSLRALAHYCIDHGADVVYGHGPHVTRAIEVYKDRFIAYSLGNFCTPYNVSLTGISGYAPIAEISIDKDGRFRQGKIHSFLQTRGIGPRTDKNEGAAQEMSRLSQADVPQSQALVDVHGNICLKTPTPKTLPLEGEATHSQHSL